MSVVGQEQTKTWPSRYVCCWGQSGRNQHANGHRRSNVGCWGMSGRTSGMVGTSLLSQFRTFALRKITPQFGTLRCCRWEPSTASAAEIAKSAPAKSKYLARGNLLADCGATFIHYSANKDREISHRKFFRHFGCMPCGRDCGSAFLAAFEPAGG